MNRFASHFLVFTKRISYLLFSQRASCHLLRLTCRSHMSNFHGSCVVLLACRSTTRRCQICWLVFLDRCSSIGVSLPSLFSQLEIGHTYSRWRNLGDLHSWVWLKVTAAYMATRRCLILCMTSYGWSGSLGGIDDMASWPGIVECTVR